MKGKLDLASAPVTEMSEVLPGVLHDSNNHNKYNYAHNDVLLRVFLGGVLP